MPPSLLQVVDGNWGVHAIVPKKPFGYPVATKSTDAPGAIAVAAPTTSAATSASTAAGALTLAAAVLAAAMLL